MGIVKISQLDSASALDGTEKAVVVQSGVTKETTTQAIADLAKSAVSGSFTTVDNKTVTVVNGIITSIV